MAKTYELVTATDAEIDYDNIQVKVIEGEAVAPFKIKTVLELKNAKAKLEAQLADIKAELAGIETEAAKVTTAIK